MYCSKCGAQNSEGARFCEKCGAPLGEAAVPPAPPDERVRGGYGAPPPPSYGPGYVTGKSPAVALILSMLIPGVGQLYNGDTKKGIIMLVIHFASFFGWAIGIGFVTMFAVWIWSMVDAYQVASGKSKIMA